MPQRSVIWIAILLAMTAVLLLVWRQPRTSHIGDSGEFRPLEQAYRTIRRQYYKPIDAMTLQQAAVRGMVGELDEFSTYVPAEKAQSLTRRVLGAGLGYGLVWTLDTTGLTVIGPAPDSPAYKAGLFAGDRIIEINRQAVETLSPQKIRTMLSPLAEKDIELAVVDAVTREKRTVVLAPASYPVETVQGLYRDADGRWQYQLSPDENVYYLRISEFCTDTAQRLDGVLRSLDNPQGLVLDLRDNPGGLLADGIAVADLFLREGPIVHVLGRDGERQTHKAHSDTPFSSLPLVVLIDEKTTSAAEIVAGALAANSRAVLLGRRTRGKGCVQTMIPLPGELGQINLTTAEFLLPLDVSIQRRRGAKTWGIEPQVTLKLSPDQASAVRRQRRSVCVMPRPIPTTATQPATQTATERRIWNTDPQLVMAEALLQKPNDMQALIEALAKRNRQAQIEYEKTQADLREKQARTESK